MREQSRQLMKKAVAVRHDSLMSTFLLPFAATINLLTASVLKGNVDYPVTVLFVCVCVT